MKNRDESIIAFKSKWMESKLVAVIDESSDYVHVHLRDEFANLLEVSNEIFDAMLVGFEKATTVEFDAEHQTEWELVPERIEQRYLFLPPTMVVVSVYIFLEKALKDLCYCMSQQGLTSPYMLVGVPAGEKFKVKKARNESQIDATLRFLNDRLTVKVILPPTVADGLENARVLRNAYAHGDWEEVRDSLHRIPPTLAFDLAELILDELASKVNLSSIKQEFAGQATVLPPI